jgi:hypothetical protein
MAFPKTLEELKAAGYKYNGDGTCRSRKCEARIEWWITPRGKKIPLDIDGKGNITPHWSTCPAVKDFRG